MKIEPLLYDDINEITELQPDGWSDITPKIQFYAQSDFCYPIKVVAGSKIAGIGAAIIHHDVAWLGHIIVHKENRASGLGKLITEKLIEIAKSKKCETTHLIATDLGAPVYEKVGFVTETEYLFFKDLKIESSPIQSENMYHYNMEDKYEISIIDEANSAEKRMCEFEDHLERCFIYKKNNITEGFYLPTLGEGLIIANNSVAGIELLKFHLQSSTTIVLPKENIPAISFLHENDFIEFRSAKRMTLGRKRVIKFENIYNRIGGNIG